MSTEIKYQVLWEINEEQAEQINTIQQKHEQLRAFRLLDEEYGIESLSIFPMDAEARGKCLWGGSFKYPSNFEIDDYEIAAEIVLSFLTELRRNFGGQSWQVNLADFDFPALWNEEKEMFIIDTSL